MSIFSIHALKTRTSLLFFAVSVDEAMRHVESILLGSNESSRRRVISIQMARPSKNTNIRREPTKLLQNRDNREMMDCESICRS